ncbi:MAG: 2Fe-2S iron-sulfur cluster-binding protein, partial [Actinomycetota bacterium]|nr:2Fe-2S iron-sulfur cluster-binding protein [Actinomycetota bacterium]
MTDRPSADAALDGGRIVVDGRSIAFEPGDSVAIAILRTVEVPGYDGILCLAGDCGNCLAEVDGIAYVRTCQIAARRGLVVTRHLPDGLPSLPGAAAEPRSAIAGHEIAMPAPPALAALDQIAALVRTLASHRRSAASPPRHEAKNSQKSTAPEPPATATMPDVGVVEVSRADVDVAVVGGGPSGREAAAAEERKGRSVLVLDAGEGNEVVAIYAGPLVVARTPTGMLHVQARRVVVATGAAEIHAVAPGSHLSGLLTARAAERMHAAGIPLGDAVAIGTAPAGLSVPSVAGRLVRFEGDDAGRVSAVVTADEGSGTETTTPAHTVILGLGLAPRDVLARMAGAAPVRVVGEAAGEHPLPPPTTEGVVCP